jgi:hypothetical protein
MDTASIDTGMLIGGAFEGGTEAEESILNPAPARRSCGSRGSGQIDRAVGRGAQAF